MRRICRKFEWIRLRRKHIAFAACLLMAAATKTTSLHAADAVSIELQGEIDAGCRLDAVSPNVDLGTIFKIGSRQISFGINCNAPFSYSVSSQSGGLQNIYGTVAQPGFTNLIVYSVEVSIPTDAGIIGGVCASSMLTGSLPTCTYPHSGNGIAIDQLGSLTLSWSSPDDFVAGPYADVLTLHVKPQF